jgi:hypothetical protein
MGTEGGTAWNSWTGSVPTNNNQDGYFTMDNQNANTICTDMASILDGTSNTLMVGEVGRSYGVSPSRIEGQNFPVWIGGNPGNGSQTGRSTRGVGSHLRVAIAGFTVNYKLPVNIQSAANNQDLGARTGNPPSNNQTGIHFSDLMFGSYHPGIAQFAMGDGAVKAIPETTNAAVFQALAGRADGIPAQLP